MIIATHRCAWCQGAINPTKKWLEDGNQHFHPECAPSYCEAIERLCQAMRNSPPGAWLDNEHEVRKAHQLVFKK